MRSSQPATYDPAIARGGKQVPAYIWTGRQLQRGRVVRPSGIKPNWHLVLTLSGRGSFRQPGDPGLELPLIAGDLILFAPDCHQDYGPVAEEPWENIFAHFAPRPQWHAWMRWPKAGDGLFHVHLPEGPVLDGARDAMLRADHYAHSAFSAFAHELALSALEEAILLGAHQARFGSAGEELSTGIARVVARIAGDLCQRFTVRALAREAGYSPSRFAHVFKDEIGEPVIAYINRLRIREAARLLEVEGMSVKQAAAAVGFRSPFYFSRQFRRFYLLDPSSYRRYAAGLRIGGGGAAPAP